MASVENLRGVARTEQFVQQSGNGGSLRRHDRVRAERNGHGLRQVRPYSREGTIFRGEFDEISQEGTSEIIHERPSGTIDLAKLEKDREIKIAILDHGVPEALIDALD